MTEDPIYLIRCDACGAPPRYSCVTIVGGVRRSPHPSRVTAARTLGLLDDHDDD